MVLAETANRPVSQQQEISRYIFSRRIDKALGLTGNVSSVETYTTGIQGGKAVNGIHFSDGRDSIVVKMGDPDVIAKEVAAYRFIQGTPLEPLYLQLVYVDPKGRYFALQHSNVILPGKIAELRDAFRNGQYSTSGTIAIFDERNVSHEQLNSETPVTKSQQRTEAIVSMQEAEWLEASKPLRSGIIERAKQLVDSINAQGGGVSLDTVLTAPINFNGRVYKDCSILHMMNTIRDRRKERKKRGYTPWRGNADPANKNVMVVTENDAEAQRRLETAGKSITDHIGIDLEMLAIQGAHTDLAEYLAIAGKGIASKTVFVEDEMIAYKDGNLVINASVVFPPGAEEFQNYAWEQTKMLAQEKGLSDLVKQVWIHRMWSLSYEFAFNGKGFLYALGLAAESLDHVKHPFVYTQRSGRR